MLNQLFVVLNFFILVALLLYAWLHYGVPYIKAEQISERDHDSARDNAYITAIQQQQKVEKQVLVETIRREKLLLGMHQWLQSVQREKIKAASEAENSSKKMCILMSKQYVEIQKRCFQRRVVQPAVIQVEQELSELYHTDSAKARSFIEAVCTQVRKEVI
jgi:hypothetical protein